MPYCHKQVILSHEKKRTAASSVSTTKSSKQNAIKNITDAFAITIASAKNTLIGRLTCALLCLGAMFYIANGNIAEGLSTGMLYMIAENGKKSGRADGNSYMRNGRIRGMAIPSNPNTAYQTTQRGNFGTLSSGWNALTEVQRLAWNVFSIQVSDRFGRTVFVSGKAAYVALNRNLFNTGDSAIAEPPIPVGVPSPSSLSLSADSAPSTLDLSFTPSPVPANYSWLVYATGAQSVGTYAPSASKYRLIGTIIAGGTTPADIEPDYVAKFGALVGGTKIFVKVVAISTSSGIASAPVTASAIVAA